MKMIKNILKFGGLFLIALGYIIPWYSWNVELVKDRVVSSLFGAGTTISGLQFILPQTLVRAVPSSSAQYFMFQGLTPAGVLEEIGLTWSIVPALVLVLFIVFWGLLFVTRGQARPAIREGVVPLAIGGSILLALLLWNPAPPPSLARIELVPAGKFIPILGSFLLALAGLIHLLVRKSSAQPLVPVVSSENQAPKFHICLKCHECVDIKLDVCPTCGKKFDPIIS